MGQVCPAQKYEQNERRRLNPNETYPQAKTSPGNAWSNVPRTQPPMNDNAFVFRNPPPVVAPPTLPPQPSKDVSMKVSMSVRQELLRYNTGIVQFLTKHKNGVDKAMYLHHNQICLCLCQSLFLCQLLWILESSLITTAIITINTTLITSRIISIIIKTIIM